MLSLLFFVLYRLLSALPGPGCRTVDGCTASEKNLSIGAKLDKRMSFLHSVSQL